MNDLQTDELKTPDENSAMVLLVDDQAMIGEAVRRGTAGHESIDFHFVPTRIRRSPGPCRSSRR